MQFIKILQNLIQNCELDSKANKRTQQLPLKLALKHFKNLVKSTVFIVCLKDRKLLKLMESGRLFHTLITLQEKKIYSDFTTSKFIQFICMPSSIRNRTELKKSPE